MMIVLMHLIQQFDLVFSQMEMLLFQVSTELLVCSFLVLFVGKHFECDQYHSGQQII